MNVLTHRNGSHAFEDEADGTKWKCLRTCTANNKPSARAYVAPYYLFDPTNELNSENIDIVHVL